MNPTTGEIANLDLELIQSTFEPDEEAIFEYLTNNFPDKSVREIIGGKEVSGEELPLLASRLPYNMLVVGTEFNAIPAGLRHSLTIAVTDTYGYPSLTFTQSLPELAASRIILGYVPASEADQDALAALISEDT